MSSFELLIHRLSGTGTDAAEDEEVVGFVR